MATDQTALELGPQGVRDVPCGERTETGRDAVVRDVGNRQVLDDLPALADLAQRLTRQRNARAVPGDGDNILSRERPWPDIDGLDTHAAHCDGSAVARRPSRSGRRAKSDTIETGPSQGLPGRRKPA